MKTKKVNLYFSQKRKKRKKYEQPTNESLIKFCIVQMFCNSTKYA